MTPQPTKALASKPKPPTRNYCVTEHARTEEGEGLVSRLPRRIEGFCRNAFIMFISPEMFFPTLKGIGAIL